MYSLLIAHSEQIIVEGLKSMIDNNALDLKILPSAHTENDALETAVHHQPDIMIVGDSYPDGTGEELIQRVFSADFPRPLMIIISGREDFQALRQALRLGVFDYFVQQEITAMELNRTLIRASEYLDHFSWGLQRPNPTMGLQFYRRLFYVRLLISDDLPDEPEEVMRHLGIRFTYPYYAVIYFTTVKKTDLPVSELDEINQFVAGLLQKRVSALMSVCQTIPWRSNSFAVILASDQGHASEREPLTECLHSVIETIREQFHLHFKAGIGSIVTDLQEIRNSFLGSQAVINYTSDEQDIVFYDDVANDYSLNIRYFMRHWTDAVDDENPDMLEEMINYLEQFLNRREFHLRQMLVTCTDLLYTCMGRLSGLSRSILSEFTDLTYPTLTIMPLKNAEDIVNWFRMLKRHIVTCFNEKDKDERKLIIVDAMKKYITEHWDDPLSLQEVAEKFHFSPSYISRLFKQCNDCGFSDYVTRVKIEQSKKLLREPDATVNSVADRLGYTDPYYFSKVFKKYNNVSPREYMIHFHLSDSDPE